MAMIGSEKRVLESSGGGVLDSSPRSLVRKEPWSSSCELLISTAIVVNSVDPAFSPSLE